MKTVFAEFNHGRWIAICPACREQGVISALQVEPNDVFVCPTEYPDTLAETFIPNPRVQGAFNSVPDIALRDQARRSAIEAGNGYEVVFPPEKKEIERVLRFRPVFGRNWWVGVTLEDLRTENQRGGLDA